MVKFLISNYHEYKSEEFILRVEKEDDDYYYCFHLEQDKSRFQDGYVLFKLRKCLVGDTGIYKEYNGKVIEEVSLF